WTAVWFAGDLIEVDPLAVGLVLAGGLAYTGGAVVYGLKRPDPVAGVYGFHEVFHTCTVVAFACHWAAMLLFVLGGCPSRPVPRPLGPAPPGRSPGSSGPLPPRVSGTGAIRSARGPFSPARPTRRTGRPVVTSRR